MHENVNLIIHHHALMLDNMHAMWAISSWEPILIKYAAILMKNEYLCVSAN